MPAPTDRAAFRSDVRVIGLIAAAHFFSHFFQLTLPPLFPLLKEIWGVPYVALGLAISVFYGASGLGQPVSGFLVDRMGAHRVLLGWPELRVLGKAGDIGRERAAQVDEGAGAGGAVVASRA